MKAASPSLKRQARRLFDLVREKDRVDEYRLRVVVAELAARNPRGCVPLLKDLLRRTAIEAHRHSARIETAIPLSASRRETLSDTLMGLYGASLDIRFRENPALLGGVRIQVGDTLIDGSVRGRLEEFNREL